LAYGGDLPSGRFTRSLVELRDLALVGKGDVFVLASIFVEVLRLRTTFFPYRWGVSQDIVVLNNPRGIEEVEIAKQFRRGLSWVR